MVNIIITVDDVHPEQDYGLIDDIPPMSYINDLIENFGAKFTFFVVPKWNNDDRYDIRQHKDWIKNMSNNIEISGHGLYHFSNIEKFSSQEFRELENEEIKNKLSESFYMFKDAGIDIKGFKFPGWYTPIVSHSILNELGCKYVCVHNKDTDIKITKDYDGIKRVPYSYGIDELPDPKTLNDDDTILLTSHISNKGGNHNSWSKLNYYKVLSFLKNIENKKFLSVGDLVE